jgi:outer membrane protein TolC
MDDAIRLMLEHELNLQIERYNPIIIGYNVRSLAGTYYDPVFNAGWQRSDARTETGGFNTGTGAPFPGSQSQNDTLSGGLGGYLPTGMRYDLFNNYTESLNNRAFFDPTNGLTKFHTDTWSAAAGIRVTQPLLRDFWTDAPRTAIKLRKKDKLISDLTLEQVVHDKVQQVIEAYYTFVGKLEAVVVAKTDLQVKQQNFTETRRKVEVGTLAQLDEAKAQSEVSLALSALDKAQNDAGDAEATLKTLISANFVNQIGVRLEPTDKLLVIPVSMDLPTSFRLAMEKRPDLQAKREQLERQNIQLKYNFNQLFPRLDVVASWGVNGLDPHLDGAVADLERKDFQQDSYGLFFTIPLTLTAERNNYKAAKTRKKQLITELEAAEQTATFDVDTAMRAVASAYRVVFHNRDAVAFAEKDLAAEKTKFATGKSTSFFVLEAASRLAQARNDEIQSEVDYNVALSKLSHAEGTILEAHKIDIEAVRWPMAPTAPAPSK